MEVVDAESPEPEWSIRSIHRTHIKQPSESKIAAFASDVKATAVTMASSCKQADAYSVIEPDRETDAERAADSSNERPSTSRRSSNERFESVNTNMDNSRTSTRSDRSHQSARLSSKSTRRTTKKNRLSRRLLYDLEIQNLTYKVNVRASTKEEVKNKTLLNCVNAKANNSEILAIIGRSGSSKTTLLDALAGHIDSTSLEGSILVNGFKMDAGLKSISGYVTQEDYLFPMLTTEETLMFSARLRLSTKISAENKEQRVQALIEELGLTSCAHTRVGNEKIRGISGGERRRLSIGVDLIHDPPVLLLDEPTSGLDSTSALQVMETLYKLAVRRRHTIVMTVHQPSFRILELIHRTLVLAKGLVVYHGPVEDMVDHFKSRDRPMPDHVNVVEFVLDTVAEYESKPDDLQTLVVLQKERASLRTEDGQIRNENRHHRHLQRLRRRRKFATSFASELWVLSHRNFFNIFRTHTLFWTRVGLTILTSLILISLFVKSSVSEKGLQQRQTFIIFTVAILVFTSTEALPIFLLERQILIREKSRGAYRISSYAVAHSLVVLPFLLFLAILCTGMSYFPVGLVPNTSAFFFFLFVIFLVLSMSNAFVACVSSLAPNFTVALSVVGGASAYMFLFSGFFMNRKEIPWYWLWLHYTSLFKGEVNQTLNISIMVLFVVGYRLIFYLALRFYTKSVRK